MTLRDPLDFARTSTVQIYQNEYKTWIFDYATLQENPNIIQTLIDAINDMDGERALVKNISLDIMLKYNEKAINKAVPFGAANGIPIYFIKKNNN
jgi:hypothetical protein